jgi:hypothetical protein
MVSNWKTRNGCVLLPALLLAGCFQHAENAGSGPQAVPPSYRQLVAATLAAKIDLKEYRDPKISAPVVRNVSEFGFGVRPSVCVQAVPVRGGIYPAWIVVFQDGKVADMFVPSIALGCHGLDWSPFPELLDRRI